MNGFSHFSAATGPRVGPATLYGSMVKFWREDRVPFPLSRGRGRAFESVDVRDDRRKTKVRYVSRDRVRSRHSLSRLREKLARRSYILEKIPFRSLFIYTQVRLLPFILSVRGQSARKSQTQPRTHRARSTPGPGGRL